MFVPYFPSSSDAIFEAHVELAVDIITRVQRARAQSIEATREAEIE